MDAEREQRYRAGIAGFTRGGPGAPTWWLEVADYLFSRLDAERAKVAIAREAVDAYLWGENKGERELLIQALHKTEE